MANPDIDYVIIKEFVSVRLKIRVNYLNNKHTSVSLRNRRKIRQIVREKGGLISRSESLSAVADPILGKDQCLRTTSFDTSTLYKQGSITTTNGKLAITWLKRTLNHKS